MSVVAEFHLDARVLQPALEEVPEMYVEVEQELALDSERALLTFWASGGDFAAFERALTRDETIEEVECLSDTVAGWRFYRAAVPPAESSYWKWADLGAVLLAATGWPDGWDIRMRFPDQAALAEFHNYCLDRGLSFTLNRLEHPAGSRAGSLPQLTPAQRELVTYAHTHGYFEIPRGITLAEIADHFNISTQAASNRLRRAVANLLDQHGV